MAVDPRPGSFRIVHRENPALVYSARDPYVERYWLPWLGPTAIVLLRRLALDAELSITGETDYTYTTLTVSIGLGDEKHLIRTLSRLARFGFAADVGWSSWAVDTRLPAVSEKHYRRLPVELADELREGV